MDRIKFETVEDYIFSFPVKTQINLRLIRKIVKESAPGVEEAISYKMPSYWLNGILLYFAAYKHHIGFYPLTTAIEEFKDDLHDFKWAKGSIQFQLDKPLPVDLITRIVRFRVRENNKKSKRK